LCCPTLNNSKLSASPTNTSNGRGKGRKLQFSDRPAKFQQGRLWVLKTVLFCSISSKWGILASKFSILERKFFDRLKFRGGAIASPKV